MRALIVSVAAAAVVVVGCTGSGGAAPAQLSAGACTIPTAVAHRGGYADVGRTEDTVGAYVKAHGYGLDEWETDVRFDRDGIPYLMHDSPIGRTTDGGGWASSVDIAITAVKMDDGTLLRDQSLDRLLSYASKLGATVAIEPKVAPTAAQAQRIEDLIDKWGMRDRVLLDSFHTANLAPLKAVAPDLLYSLVSSTAVSPAAAKAVGPILNVADAVLTPALVAAYHAAGVKVYAWTVDDRAVWEAQKGWGIDRFVTNRPALYRGWRDYACTGIPWRLG